LFQISISIQNEVWLFVGAYIGRKFLEGRKKPKAEKLV